MNEEWFFRKTPSDPLETLVKNFKQQNWSEKRKYHSIFNFMS